MGVPHGVTPKGLEHLDRRRLPAGTFERRERLVRPLFIYAADHGIVLQWVMRTAFERRGQPAPKSTVVSKIKVGRAPLPDWLIQECCAAIGRPIGEVMSWCGPEWIAEFGAEYGIEAAAPAA